MTNETKAVLLHIEEELEGANEELMFEHSADSMSFNLQSTSKTNNIRLTHNFIDNKTTYIATDDESDVYDNDDTVITYLNNKNDYIILTDNHLDTPLLYAPDMNYIVIPNHELLIEQMEIINKFSVCLTTIDNFAENNPEVTIRVIQLDNSTFNANTTPSSSLFEMAVASEKEGVNGVDAINKYIHSAYKSVSAIDNNTLKTHEVVSPVTINKETLPVIASDASDEITATVKSTTVLLKLKELIADDKYQLRVTEDASAIKDLASAYQDGDSVPAIEVIDTGTKYIIVDGFHRFAAASEAGLDSIECLVTVGTERDAFIISLGANANNKALKRTNADKRKAVESALFDEICKDLSSREIASICKVSHTIVNRIKNELAEKKNISTVDTDTVIEEVVTEALPPKAILEDTTGNVSTSSKTSKPYKKTLSFKGISVVLNIQTIANKDALNELLADLNGAIDSYISMLEEGS